MRGFFAWVRYMGAVFLETIDGASTQIINSQYAGITVVSDGANWIIVAKF